MPEWLHPVLPLLLGALLMPAVGLAARRALSVLAPLTSLGVVLALPDGASLPVSVLGFELELLRVDALARVMAVAFTSYAAIAGLFAWSEEGRLSKGAGLLLATGGVGVVLAGDLWSLLLFWETLAVASLGLIWSSRTRAGLDAGYRYIVFHLLGGLLLLGGILMHLAGGGSGAVASLDLAGPSAWLLLAGVAVNAGIPPLHAWLPDAYPRATIFGTVFLAAFTTKSAVYVLARLFPGAEPLVWLGGAMALYGVTFAMLENDVRRLLSYHIVSQVGFMVCGVGLGSALALDGATAHAFCHIYYKGLLLMSAGAVIHAAGSGRLNELGNLARPLKWILVMMVIGAWSISGVPGLNGFVSKSMTISAAAKVAQPAAELMLLCASVGTFLSVGMKLVWFTFFGSRGSDAPRTLRPIPATMLAAMGVAALVCVVTGVAPGLLYAALPNGGNYHPYTLDHVLTSLELLLATALVFWVFRAALIGKQAAFTLDLDRLYRRPLSVAVDSASGVLAATFAAAERALRAFGRGAWRAWRAGLPRLAPGALAYRVALAMLCCAALWFLTQGR